MSEPNKYTTTEDIYAGTSRNKTGKTLLAKKGEVVTEISDRGNVKIVETKRGNKIPVEAEKLKAI